MDGYLFLFYNNLDLADAIIFSGKRSGEREITFLLRSNFCDALKMLEQPRPPETHVPRPVIPLESTMVEALHFYDPHLLKQFKLIFHRNVITIIDSDQELTIESISSVFKYFLIKKGERVLFLTDLPNHKFKNKEADPPIK